MSSDSHDEQLELFHHTEEQNRELVNFPTEEELLKECQRLLVSLSLHHLAEKLTVRWNPRMKSSAGRAFWPDAIIELNLRLAMISQDEIQRTLRHELAHLVAYQRAGRRRIAAHGAEWQLACTELGIPGEKATHNLPLPSRRQKKRWRYTCPSCGNGFDRVRRMKRAAGCYDCCKIHNGGYFHKTYQLVETRISSTK